MKAAQTVQVDFLQGWRWPTGLVVVPVLLLLLGLWIGGAFTGVAQAKYDQLQNDNQTLTKANQKLLVEGRYYFDQAQQYRRKFPKTASSFPKYVAPLSSQPMTH